MEISLYDKLLVNEYGSVEFFGTNLEYWKMYPYRHDEILFETAKHNETLRKRLVNGSPIVAALEHQFGDCTQLSLPSAKLREDLEELIGYKESNSSKASELILGLTGSLLMTILTNSLTSVASAGFTIIRSGINSIKLDNEYKKMRNRAEILDHIISLTDID